MFHINSTVIKCVQKLNHPWKGNLIPPKLQVLQAGLYRVLIFKMKKTGTMPVILCECDRADKAYISTNKTKTHFGTSMSCNKNFSALPSFILSPSKDRNISNSSTSGRIFRSPRSFSAPMSSCAPSRMSWMISSLELHKQIYLTTLCNSWWELWLWQSWQRQSQTIRCLWPVTNVVQIKNSGMKWTCVCELILLYREIFYLVTAVHISQFMLVIS